MVKLFSAQFTTKNPFPDEIAAGRLMNDYMRWAQNHQIGADLCMAVSTRNIRISVSFQYDTEKSRNSRLSAAKKKMRELFGEIDQVL